MFTAGGIPLSDHLGLLGGIRAALAASCRDKRRDSLSTVSSVATMYKIVPLSSLLLIQR